jgi:hypothetical protein
MVYREIGDADPCSVVETVFIHALQGMAHDCSIPEAKNNTNATVELGRAAGAAPPGDLMRG